MAKAKGIYTRGRVYWIRYAGTDGRIIYESSRSTKFKDAEELLLQRKQKVREGEQPVVKKIPNYTFRELSTQYLIWAERKKSFKSKKCLVGQLTQAFGNLPLRRFDSMPLEQYQTERLQKGNKPATVNRLIAAISHMFTKAVEWNMVEENILGRIRKVKSLPENNRRLRYLSKDECNRLIECCSTHLKPIVITALNTGMRRGEILSLKWEQADLRHRYLLLSNTKNGEDRQIPMNQTLIEVYSNIPRGFESKYVFTNRSGNPFTDIKRSYHNALRKAEIQNFTFHDLRHTFASHLVMAGVDLASVKELLGHKSLSMTLRYAHLSPGHKRRAVEILDNRINKKSTIQKVYNHE